MLDYTLRKHWLNCRRKGKPFDLWNRQKSKFHLFSPEVQDFLYQELCYIREQAEIFQGKFNFAFLAEKAQKRFGYPFHRNSIRRFALKHGYYHGLSEEKGKLYIRFEASGPGVLFQHDSSHHTWLPSKGGIQYLILTQDDYSRMIVGAGLFDKETVFSHMTVAKETVLNYGLALAYYVDNHSIFKFEGYHGPHKSSISQEEGQTQFKRALRSLDIGLIYTAKGKAHAKGKIEKRFDYFQRRLPFECERYHVTDVGEGYKILKDMVDFYNNDRVHAETGEIPAKRWEEGIHHGKDRLRPLNADKDLDMIFSLHYERTIKKDGTISFGSRFWKVGGSPDAKVTVCLIPEVKFLVLQDEQKIGEYCL